MATMYIRKSRLTPCQQSEMIEYFVAGSTARAASEVDGVQANTAIRFFMHLRQLIANKQYHINGIEKFWCQAKRYTRKHNGIKPENF